MWWGLAIFLWWLVGAVSILYLKRPLWDLVWGDLILVFMLGWLGPLVGFIVVMKVLVQADFWIKPIFPKKEGRL